MKKNIDKFSFAQLTSNNNGKTSGSGTMGVLICTAGVLCFVLGCVDKIFINNDIDIITQSMGMVTIGAALLGHRNHISKNERNLPIDNSLGDSLDTICETCEKEPCECTVLNS